MRLLLSLSICVNYIYIYIYLSVDMKWKVCSEVGVRKKHCNSIMYHCLTDISDMMLKWCDRGSQVFYASFMILLLPSYLLTLFGHFLCAVLTHERPRYRTHRQGWCSSLAAGRRARWLVRSRTPSPQWQYSGPLQSWRRNPLEPAPAHLRFVACRGTSPAGSATHGGVAVTVTLPLTSVLHVCCYLHVMCLFYQQIIPVNEYRCVYIHIYLYVIMEFITYFNSVIDNVMTHTAKLDVCFRH